METTRDEISGSHCDRSRAGLGYRFTARTRRRHDDRFTLRLGAMDVDAQSELTAVPFSTAKSGFSQDFDFGGNEIVPRIDGIFRFGERSRLVFNYFKYDKDREATLDEDLSFDDITIPAGSFARAETEFQLASLMYDYSVVDTDSVSVGLQIGAE